MTKSALDSDIFRLEDMPGPSDTAVLGSDTATVVLNSLETLERAVDDAPQTADASPPQTDSLADATVCTDASDSVITDADPSVFADDEVDDTSGVAADAALSVAAAPLTTPSPSRTSGADESAAPAGAASKDAVAAADAPSAAFLPCDAAMQLRLVRDDGRPGDVLGRPARLTGIGERILLWEAPDPIQGNFFLLHVAGNTAPGAASSAAAPAGHVGVIVRHCEALPDGGVRVTAEVGGPGAAVLAEEARIPQFDTLTFRYRLPLDEAVYAEWSAAGVLRPRVLDRVLVCPKCAAVPTFRLACRNCGSGAWQQQLHVHHFACAFVAPLEEFTRSDPPACPKCRVRQLVAGTDFEYMPGDFACEACGWTDGKLQQTGHCLSCDHRFPAHQAVEQELVGYDAERLDVLDFATQLG